MGALTANSSCEMGEQRIGVIKMVKTVLFYCSLFLFHFVNDPRGWCENYGNFNDKE